MSTATVPLDNALESPPPPQAVDKMRRKGFAPGERFMWAESLPFFIFHLAAFSVLLFPFSWKLVGLAVASYYVRMFGITAGYHRYFSHRAFKTSRVGQFLLAILAQASVQKGALWWGSHHRYHHKHSDLMSDTHSAHRHGFWYAHCGWILTNKNSQTLWHLIPDLAKYPELRFLNRYPHVASAIWGVLMFAIGGWAGFAWGFVLSTVFLWHGTFTINSLTHLWGSRRYESGDESTNNLWLALITMGEGWHNNHHTYMHSTRQGFFWYEVDPSYYILKMLSWVGIVWDLRDPPLKMLEAKRIKAKAY